MTRPDPRRGATAVEFVLILPLLLTLVLACVDFGRVGHAHVAVTNAARAGAGYGSGNAYTPATYARWSANVRQAVVDEMSQLKGFNAAQLTVTTTVVPEGSGRSRVEVQVSYPFRTAVNWPGLPSLVTMRRTVAMEMVR